MPHVCAIFSSRSFETKKGGESPWVFGDGQTGREGVEHSFPSKFHGDSPAEKQAWGKLMEHDLI